MTATKVYRSAITGEFVTEEHALLNPSTTVCETVTVTVEDETVEAEPIKIVLWGPLTGYMRKI